MSSINPGFGPQSLPSSIAGISPSGKNTSAQKAEKSDTAAALTVEKANADATGLHGSEKSEDRDADGRQLYHSDEDPPSPADSPSSDGQTPAPRSTDPQKQRGTHLDLDA